MRTALERFNREHSLPELLGVPLRKTCSTNGGEWHGPCPLCGGDDRLRVYPTPSDRRPRAVCRGCGRTGDAVRWAMWLGGHDPDRPGATARFLVAQGYLEDRGRAEGRSGPARRAATGSRRHPPDDAPLPTPCPFLSADPAAELRALLGCRPS